MQGRTNALSAAGISVSLVVSAISGAAITATKGSKTVSGTAVNGSCTLALPEAGTWSVVSTYGGSTLTETVNVIDSYAVVFPTASPTLNDNDWSVIREISDAGQGANFWSVGDSKTVQLTGTLGEQETGFTVRAFILGFNHNASLEGQNRIHFQLAKTSDGGKDIAICDSMYNTETYGGNNAFSMTEYGTSAASSYVCWSESHMRVDICGNGLYEPSLTDYPSESIMAVIPSALRSVLKTVTKYTDNSERTSGTSQASDVTATEDYFFCLSEVEVWGSADYCCEYEADKQTQYAYYSAGNSLIKYDHRDGTTAARWRLRSRIKQSYGSTMSLLVSEAGARMMSRAWKAYGFAPGFCV